MTAPFDLEPGEQIVHQTRKHWFVFAVGLLPYGILAMLPFVLPKLLRLSPQLAQLFIEPSQSDPIARTLTGVWLLMVWTGAWGAFTRYYLNVWILTNHRIVEIKQRAYFARRVSSVLLNRVQDVTTNVTGVLYSLLDIGTIIVQSAGAINEFRMRGIPKPEEVRDIILKHVAAHSHKTGV
jgi:hypothetical protein